MPTLHQTYRVGANLRPGVTIHRVSINPPQSGVRTVRIAEKGHRVKTDSRHITIRPAPGTLFLFWAYQRGHCQDHLVSVPIHGFTSPNYCPDMLELLAPPVDPGPRTPVAEALVPPGVIPGMLAATTSQKAHLGIDARAFLTEAGPLLDVLGVVVVEPM